MIEDTRQMARGEMICPSLFLLVAEGIKPFLIQIHYRLTNWKLKSCNIIKTFYIGTYIMCLTDTANVFMSNKSLFGRKHPASKRCAGACFYYHTMHIVYMEIYLWLQSLPFVSDCWNALSKTTSSMFSCGQGS
jgi:hypothetical protein